MVSELAIGTRTLAHFWGQKTGRSLTHLGPAAFEAVDRVRSDGSTGTVLSFDAATSELTLDRRQSGNTSFHKKFASASSARAKLDNGVLRLRIVVDHCSVEVFAQGGSVVLTDLAFPGAGCLSTEMFADGGGATIRKLTVESLR